MSARQINTKNKVLINILSLAVGLVIIAGALIYRATYQAEPATQNNQQRIISEDELTKATGKDGAECLVAIAGTVYKIEGSDLWKDGQHTSSEGQAYCGADLTEVLKKSPHGKSKLEQLEKVGTLNQ